MIHFPAEWWQWHVPWGFSFCHGLLGCSHQSLCSSFLLYLGFILCLLSSISYYCLWFFSICFLLQTISYIHFCFINRSSHPLSAVARRWMTSTRVWQMRVGVAWLVSNASLCWFSHFDSNNDNDASSTNTGKDKRSQHSPSASGW